MILRFFRWLGCTTLGGLAVYLSFMNGLPLHKPVVEMKAIPAVKVVAEPDAEGVRTPVQADKAARSIAGSNLQG